ncbi:MAG: hypothetical protein ACOH13_11145 [Flavobacteriales bacterium]
MSTRFNGTYLTPLFMLCDHYKADGDEAATRKYNAIAQPVAPDAGRSAAYDAHGEHIREPVGPIVK